MLLAARDYIRANKAGPHRDLDLLRPPRERLERRQRPLAGAARRVPRVPAGRPLPLARLSAARHRQPVGAGDRRAPAARPATGPSCWSRCGCVAREAATTRLSLPVQFEIDGARSEVTVELAGRESELKDHRIPLERAANGAGAGCRFRPTPTRRTTTSGSSSSSRSHGGRSIVADDPQAARPLQLAAAISPDPAICSARPRWSRAEQLAAVDWDEVRAALVAGPAARRRRGQAVQAFVDRGGQVDLLPAADARRRASSSASAGQSWVDEKADAAGRDAGAAIRTCWPTRRAAPPLPVGQLQIRRYCGLAGEFTPLATLAGRRAAARAGDDQPRRRLLLHDHAGRRRFVAGHQRRRPLRAGAARPGRRCGGARATRASSSPATRPATTRRPGRQRRRALRRRSRPITRFTAGVYQAGERLLAVNRAAAEDQAPVLADAASPSCSGASTSPASTTRPAASARLIQEIWRLFLVAMMVAMVVEAGLCLPRRRSRTQQGASIMSVYSTRSRSCGRPGRSALVDRSGPCSVTAGFCFVALAAQRLSPRPWGCSSCCGWRSSLSSRSCLNQPEWIEEFRPEEKPAIAVLWDASTSMETRDVVRRPAVGLADRRGARRSRP